MINRIEEQKVEPDFMGVSYVGELKMKGENQEYNNRE